ncbi:TPA: type IV pilus major pilin [Klebsiella oxytoca]|uniref:Type IV pilus major pilin n=1 Tax=Klebsiella oxytoca TaxID=571 RepID=A0AAN5L871_KLEOX|nr:type IV pilus major pilin [Klebsiella oxytoca]
MMKINTFRLRETKQKLTARLDKYRQLKKQRGMTLLEIIIVLGIIGTIAAGVVILAQRAFDTKAMTDLANNANSVRVAVKDAYGPSGEYPAADVPNTEGLKNSAQLTGTNGIKTPIGKLVALGKLSADEALNGISGNYINVGPGKIGSGTSAKDNAGYYIQLNGLDQTQCRGILNQVGNQWDYVQVTDDGGAGTYPTAQVVLDAEPTGYNAAGTGTGGAATSASFSMTGIYRSLYTSGTGADAKNGSTIITPDLVVGACANNASNVVTLGSR